MANEFYSGAAGNTIQGGVTINDTRRMFNFGERVAELAPQQSPFFVYLSKVAKKVTDDPVFKLMEQRHQWQRRNFTLVEASDVQNYTIAGAEVMDGDSGTNTVAVSCGYDQYGKVVSGQKPLFFIEGQIVGIEDEEGVVRNFSVGTVPAVTAGAGSVNMVFNALFTANGVSFANGAKGQVIGSAFAEGTNTPKGWEDKIWDREGYCQIFKTGMNLFSNTARATRYRGISNEYQRVWTEKLMEHKMDI